MNASEENPFVSFCISCYKQEKYIVQALAGAFSQTYENMEIVVSDDCSPDGTWDVINRLVDEYRKNGGRKNVVLNRNSENLGNLRNWEVFGRLAKGELLIKADGDDISLPERTEKIVAAWVEDGKRAKVVSHRAVKFLDDGRSLGPMWQPTIWQCLGTCQAWTPDCWSLFPSPLPDDKYTIDDYIFSTRAQAAGGGTQVLMPDILTLYRMGSGITSHGKGYRQRVLRVWSIMAHSKRIALDDLEKAKENLLPANYELARRHAESDMKRAAAYEKLLGSKSFRERFSGFCALANQGPKAFILHMVYILPAWLGDVFLNALDAVKAKRALARYGQKIIAGDGSILEIPQC